MSDFQGTQIRERDAAAILLKAGFQWTEMRQGFTELGTMAFTATCLSFLVLITAASDSYGQRSGMAAFMLLVTLGFLFVALALFRFRTRTRATVFHRDGTIETPFGMPAYPEHRVVAGSHTSIMSIESRSAGGLTVVMLYSIGGDSVCLAAGLTDPEGLKVAVQLVIALTEIRQSLADGAAYGGPTLPPIRPAHRALPLVN